MNSFIFREYDIRGKVAEDFTDDVVVKLGKGFGTLAKRGGAQIIALSGDVRDTSPHLKSKFADGVTSTGVDVIDIGILPTPANYYSMHHLPIDGAVQVTGSHNPPEYNGFKMTLSGGAVYGEQIQQILKFIESEDYETGTGELTEQEILDDYIAMVLGKIAIEKPMKIALDCGNAAGALAAPEIFEKMENVEVTELFCDVDPTFPNHHPDPTVKKNLTALIKTVQEGDYDIGIAYDGDADRVGIIDDQGNIVWADYLMTLFLDEVVTNNDEIIFDVKCSQALEQAIADKGGKPVMWKTGHSLIKQKMKETAAPFGGEMSGHLFFADEYYGYDDAIYVSARVLQTLSRSERSISEHMADLPHFESTPEIRMECPSDAEKFEIAQKAQEYFAKRYDHIDVDGIRIKFGDGWGLVRSSNTQPVIVCRFEAKTSERLEEIRDLVIKKLQDFGELKVEY
ncbi:MAG: phosphomannomutase/phosphoglucomutase [Candidatus Marinimicrobia bacterium]|nr:phosphomannomutase/phosphoglucomutase [Candidatus Neomarinimicrobiota bacterium]MCF7830092.1 phosphomannomutase/phosphoglucomutase [Candidatus Neomarinimicrobiota bacterium]MCF7882139.1 phosphomannomutase/phosphoglucomutase [Candidatus Neomarinimicrobiota bacterium]